MVGGAWPFLVGGAICLVDSDNERDSTLLTSRRIVSRDGSPSAGAPGEGSPRPVFVLANFEAASLSLLLLLFVVVVLLPLQ